LLLEFHFLERIQLVFNLFFKNFLNEKQNILWFEVFFDV
jgi:hypothetical protein